MKKLKTGLYESPRVGKLVKLKAQITSFILPGSMSCFF